MFDVDLPDSPASSVLVRSFAACVASVTEIPITQLPRPGATDLAETIATWRSWLAGRGAGLVPIADPARFNWPGYWIAVVGERADRQEQTAALMFGSPAGVVLSPGDHALLGRAAADLPVRRGFLLASLNPVLPTPDPGPDLRGSVVSIFIARQATGPAVSVPVGWAIAGRGLEGDRYAQRAGTFSAGRASGEGYDLTLIQSEVLDDLELADGSRLGDADARRNLVTRGIDLNQLVGRRFRIGDVQCWGRRLCEPCAHLERLTTVGVLLGLIHRGGLRADILTDGQIATGAIIESTDQSDQS